MANHLPQPGHFFCPPVEGLGGIPVTENLDLDLSAVPAEKAKAVLEAFHSTYPELKPKKEKSQDK